MLNKYKKGKIEFEVLLFMIAIVVVSALVLWAVQSGIVTVRADGSVEEKPILNAEFIHYGREGYLAVKEFQFCSAVDDKYNCIEEKEKFKGHCRETDVRDLEMPLPMVTILAELENLNSGDALLVHHKKIPQYLLPELADRNFKVWIAEIEEGNVKLLIHK